jgi:hypothetical protein
MTRRQLEHIIRAAAATADVTDIVVVGSQAVLGAFPDAPDALRESMEADVFPRDDPQKSIVIDGAIGELSLFHETFGYFAHGVDQTTSILPVGWQNRLVMIKTSNTAGAIGWCLEPHDLAVSKLAAGRAKDFDFVGTMIAAGMINPAIVLDRLSQTPGLSGENLQLAQARITEWSKQA